MRVVGLLALLLFVLVMTPESWAQTRYQLKTAEGTQLAINAVNQKREDNSLVLYTSEYGPMTRTNPYGVEVAATPVPGQPHAYQVTQRTSIFDCQKATAGLSLRSCGNMAIPAGGIVLSATGTQREVLLKALPTGTTLTLTPLLTFESRLPISAVNPTPESNPPGSGFPGYRGGNQLILYDVGYGQATTGTNEFGFEVTVKNDRVVTQEGANSRIPSSPGDYVLSGHGKARQWLLQNAPVGSLIKREGHVVVSVVDKDSYLVQLDKTVAKIEQLQPGSIPPTLMQRVTVLKDKAYQATSQDVAQEALALDKELTPLLWSSYPRVEQTVLRAVWHRPSEGTRQEIRQSLDLLKQAGFNTIYLETYLHGDPIFTSATFQRYRIAQTLPFVLSDAPTADLLEVWLNEAHQRQMKVHVWFQTFYAGNKRFDNGPGSILNVYPQWANVQRSALGKSPLPPSSLESGAYFLDPANNDVQTFLLSLIEEIVTRYPIDGFQLDYIRYPASFPPDRFSYVATTWGYTDTARTLFQYQAGVDPAQILPTVDPEHWAQWNAFKVRQIDRFVQQAHDRIKSIKPGLPLSVAVFPKIHESLQRKHQNWATWARNHWVDVIAPMTLTSSLESIAADTRLVHQESGLPVMTGVFGPFNGNSPTDVVDQVWTAFRSGADGIALFDTAHLTQKMAEALQAGIFNFPKPIEFQPPKPPKESPTRKKKRRR